MSNTIIGFSGFSEAGKDATAGFIVEERGAAQFAFADVLKESVYQLNPFVINKFGRYVRYQDIVDEHGLDWAKNELKEVRRLLQYMGTEVGRNLLGENIWVDAVLHKAEKVSGPVVITDVRFINELEAVQNAGGVVVRVERPGIGPKNDHPSETELIGADFDYYIDNDGSLADLRLSALDLFDTIDGKE